MTPPPSSAAPVETPITAQKKGIQLEWVRRASVVVGVALLFIIFSVLTSSFYQPANLLDILLQSSINAMIAVGMTLVVMTRGIDLSVGSVVGLSSMIAASLLQGNLVLGIAAGMLIGVFCGLVNGFLIAKLKLPDFIVTLGMLSIYRGAAVMGGASLFGGEGNPLGSLVGALTLGAMQNGLTLLNVPSFWQLVATGVVVILAVFADQATRRRK